MMFVITALMSSCHFVCRDGDVTVITTACPRMLVFMITPSHVCLRIYVP